MTTLEVLVAKSKTKTKKTDPKQSPAKKAPAKKDDGKKPPTASAKQEDSKKVESAPEKKTETPPKKAEPAPEKKTETPPKKAEPAPCVGTVDCSCAVCNPDIVDPEDEAKDAEFAFNLTSFVMIVSSIFVVFGGFYVANKYIPFSSTNFYFRYHFAQQALVVSFLLMEVGILMKLYALLSRLAPREDSEERSLSEWFLKVAAATFVVASAAIVVFSAIIRSRELASMAVAIGQKAGLLLRQAADTLALQSFGMAAIFLLLAILALVQVLFIRLFGSEPSI